LPARWQVGQRRERLLVAGRRVPAVDLVEVDVVDVEATQAVLEGRDQPAAGAATGVAVLAHRQAGLGGEHDVVPPPGEGLAEHLLGLAGAVDVGGVDQVDAGVEGRADEGVGVGLGGAADLAEVHGAESERTDVDAGAAERAVLHGNSSRGRRRAAPCRRPLCHSGDAERCSATLRNNVPLVEGGVRARRTDRSGPTPSG
jgi:hypothetical protein